MQMSYSEFQQLAQRMQTQQAIIEQLAKELEVVTVYKEEIKPQPQAAAQQPS